MIRFLLAVTVFWTYAITPIALFSGRAGKVGLAQPLAASRSALQIWLHLHELIGLMIRPRLHENDQPNIESWITKDREKEKGNFGRDGWVAPPGALMPRTVGREVRWAHCTASLALTFSNAGTVDEDSHQWWSPGGDHVLLDTQGTTRESREVVRSPRPRRNRGAPRRNFHRPTSWTRKVRHLRIRVGQAPACPRLRLNASFTGVSDGSLTYAMNSSPNHSRHHSDPFYRSRCMMTVIG